MNITNAPTKKFRCLLVGELFSAFFPRYGEVKAKKACKADRHGRVVESKILGVKF
jgi:hypothetical protein